MTLKMLMFVLSALLVGNTGFAADPELKHAPQYKAGDVRKTEIQVQTRQSLTIAGMALETQSDNFLVARETVVSAEPDGKSMAKYGFESIQIDLKLPGGLSYQFNSGNPAASQAAIPELNDMTKLFTAMSKSEWTAEYAPGGKVVSLEYAGDGLKDVPESLRDGMEPDDLKRKTQQELSRLPGKVVAVGDTWERQEEQSLGSGQTFHFTKKYTYTGSAERGGKTMHRIASTISDIKYEAAEAFGPLEVKGSSLKVESSDGTLWYDPEKRELVETSETMHVIGEIKFSAAGQELPSTIDLTMTSSSKLQ